jgi:predicted nucleic acid-binding protein
MRLVLDSSVAFKWVVPEIDSVNAVRLRDAFRKGVHDILSPDVFFVELAHSLTRAERQKRIPVSSAGALLLDVLTTPPAIVSFDSLLLLRACAISSRERIGFYDCLYVALAEREGCEFLTADDRLIKNLSQQFPFIIALSSLP